MRMASFLLLGLLLIGQALAEDFSGAKAGDLLQVRLDQLHPTQAVVGYDQIYYKLGRFSREPAKLFDDYCEANGQGESRHVPRTADLHKSDSFSCEQAVGTLGGDMKSVVVGPQGQLYLTDGHHTFTSFWEQPGAGSQVKVWVRVSDNFSDSADMPEFWGRMRQARKVWLKDAEGHAIEPTQLPQTLGVAALGNDPYRGLLYFVREVGYEKPRSGESVPEFLEFYWGDWLRQQLPLSRYDLQDSGGYRDAIEAAAQLMTKLPAQAPVGDSGFTASQLGAYSSLDRKELGKVVSRKLSYMLQYKRSQ
jgi:hypothetical protein